MVGLECSPGEPQTSELIASISRFIPDFLIEIGESVG